MIYSSVLPFTFKEVSSSLLNFFSSQKRIGDFEAKLEDYFGLRAIAVDSGQTAIRLCLKAAGLKAGDEVAIPAYLCERVAKGLTGDGYNLLFIDTDEDYNISIEDFLRKATARTAAVLAVHSYGIPCRIKELARHAKTLGVKVIDDSAQTFGGRLDGKLLGTFGDCGILSFGWFKPLTAMGGGALLSGDDSFIKTARNKLINTQDYSVRSAKLAKSIFYLNKDLYHKVIVNSYRGGPQGSSSILKSDCGSLIHSSLQASQSSIGIVQMNRIEEFNLRRIENARYLAGQLSGIKASLPEIDPAAPLLRLPMRLFSLSREKTLAVSRRFFEQGVDAPMLYPCLPDVLGAVAKCPNARALSEQTINLPIHPCLDRNDLDRIASVAKKVCKGL